MLCLFLRNSILIDIFHLKEQSLVSNVLSLPAFISALQCK